MKKIISLLLSIFILVGCTSTSVDYNDTSTSSLNLEDISNTYTLKLENFKSKTRNKNNTVDNVEFDDFLDETFINQVKDNYFLLHNYIRDYNALGIEKPEVTLGEIEYSADEEAITNELDELDKLLSFDYDSLSYRQQIDYECLEYSFYEDLSTIAYWKYSRIFISDASFVSGIVDAFVNFDFWDKESVDDYIVLLNDVKRYIDDAITYTNLQYEDGIYTSDYSLDITIDYIDSFTSKKTDNVLITTFNNTINNLEFLTAEEKNNYIEKNEELVGIEVIPAFNNLKTKLNDYKGKVDSDDGELIDYSNGFAEVSFMLSYSDNETVDVVYDELIDAFNAAVEIYNTEDEELLNEFEELYDDEMFQGSYSSLIDFMIASLPDSDELKYSLVYKVEDIDESIVNNTTTAYYEIGPLDIFNDNIIKVNPNFSDKNIEMYMTLAHEGVPGHMYQINYFQSTNPKYIRESMTFLGYTEGYASFAEFLALDYLDISDELKEYVINYIMINYLYYCILDISINYYGYSSRQLSQNLGISTDSANDLIDYLADMPCVYESYGVGYMKMYDLYLKAKEELGNKFDLDEFADVLIANGPMPYAILETIVDEYIESK